MRVNFSKLWQPAWDHKMALRKTSSIHHVGINRLNVGPPLSKVDYKGNIARPVWVWYTCWNGWAPFSSSCIWRLGKNWKKNHWKSDLKYTQTLENRTYLQFLECFKIEIKAWVPSLTLPPFSVLALIKKVFNTSKMVSVFKVLAMIFLPSTCLTGFKIFFGVLLALFFKFAIMAGVPIHILLFRLRKVQKCN